MSLGTDNTFPKGWPTVKRVYFTGSYCQARLLHAYGLGPALVKASPIHLVALPSPVALCTSPSSETSLIPYY